MRTKKVTVTAYDPRWPREFEAIRRELEAALGETAVGIEHVGSTSVPGLSAKPIIDIDVVIADHGALPEAVRKLAEIGYCWEGDLGIPDREAFCYEGKDHLCQHHLYVCPADSEELHRHITFRNYLRSHPEAAAAYGTVKEEAARLYPDSIEGYMAHKAAIVEELYGRCGLEGEDL